MTDILTTDTSIATASGVARRGRRANQILAIALAVTVTAAAGFVAANLTGGGESVSVDRTVSAVQLRWEGLASAHPGEPAGQRASQLRWEGLAAQASVDPTASQLRWEGLADRFAGTTDRSITAQTERWNAVAADHGMR